MLLYINSGYLLELNLPSLGFFLNTKNLNSCYIECSVFFSTTFAMIFIQFNGGVFLFFCVKVIFFLIAKNVGKIFKFS